MNCPYCSHEGIPWPTAPWSGYHDCNNKKCDVAVFGVDYGLLRIHMLSETKWREVPMTALVVYDTKEITDV
jgi:hypothetical protein